MARQEPRERQRVGAKMGTKAKKMKIKRLRAYEADILQRNLRDNCVQHTSEIGVKLNK